jgi:branched-chain amino acid transport system permease protein
MRTVWTMGFVAAAVLAFCLPDFIVFRFNQAVVWSIALLGLVILCGVSGQFSFAQAALYGMGGYSAAMSGNLFWGLPIAVVAGYGAGYGIGRIAGRHSLWTQALVTYAIVIAFPQLLRWRLIEYWTGGVQGLYLDLPLGDKAMFLLSLAFLALGIWLASNIVQSRSGRALMAARDDELAAAGQGIDVAHVRAVASGIAGAYVAVAGALAAGLIGFVGPTGYTFSLSVQMLFGLVIGGMNSVAGAIVGGLFLQFFPDVTAGLGKGLSALLYAVLLVAAIVAMPNGIAGAVARLIRSLRSRGLVNAVAAKGQAPSPPAD